MTPIKIQRLVKSNMEEIFGVKTVDDYALHEPPDHSALRLYAQDGRGGPNPDDLRIDMRNKISSEWNVKVLDILLAAVLKNAKTGEAWEGLPNRSNDYFMEIIQDQMERARTIWRNAQPKRLESGEIESLIEVEKRMVETRDSSAKTKRANTRRINVGFFIVTYSSCLKGLL